MPESTSEVTATPIAVVIDPFQETSDAAKAEISNIEHALAQAAGQPITKTLPCGCLNSCDGSCIRWKEQIAKGTNAMKLAEQLTALMPPDASDVACKVSDEEIRQMFSTSRSLEDLVQDFCERRLPRVYQYFWGKKLTQAVNDSVGPEANDNDPRVLKVYFAERTRKGRAQSQGSVESVRKIKTTPSGTGRVRFLAANR